ncbi:portal protein [Pandoraea anapnoica]|uniref:Portal protein n=1 Tax=Pandoraea anapnoica TaxID=2508301 RepID=A0A5E5A9W9_9BURK|nr:phage portal protein [Pandoraea anapnoica]VVE68880.1 portal protein [Pandoraea anapnoica]
MKGTAKKPGRIKAAVLDWLGVPIGLSDGAFWDAYLAAGSSSGQAVTEKSMLQLSAVWGCVRLISETISTLPLSMYERTGKGKRAASTHPLNWIIHDQPNADTTASVFWESVVAAMLLRGNARAEKLVLGGKVVGLNFLAPQRLAISKRGNGTLSYRYTEKDGRQRDIPADRIWLIPGFSLDGESGVSVIQYGANVFGAAQAADVAANKTFESGLLPAVAFKMDRVLTPAQREDFRENLKKITGALNAGESPLLEGGMSTESVGINPSDAQLLESRGFSVEEICRWFRVPPWMVGHSEKSTSWGTGIEQQMIAFLTFTLAPWLKRIEQAISKDLLTPAERIRYYAKFSVEGLLRADSVARATFYSVMVNNGILTRDEVRELEEREPMGGNAAVLTVQSAMTMLDAIGADDPMQQARAHLRTLLGLQDDTSTRE